MAQTATASVPLLHTKLHAPHGAGALVPRARLDERLAAGTHKPLTILVAPTGFGKTTLVADWLRRQSHLSAGWLSLDPTDNDPALFWAYVVAALQSAAPDVGGTITPQLFAPDPPSSHEVARMLITDLATLSSPIALVLDDYHLITNEEIDRALGFLLDHAPAQLRLVLVSRTEPRFPLGRMRARGLLAELGAPDLRFTSDEAASFLSGLEGLELTPQATQLLGERTEGWIAGLQLAALSLRGRSEVEARAASFSGDHPHIADLLVEEVLERQSADTREFLLDTAVLERLSGPLCDAVTGREGSHRTLEELERAQLFLVHLDHTREWYRYHHLFAEMLRTRGLRDRPDRTRTLHLRASRWFEDQGLTEEAVDYALRSGDDEAAAALVERSWTTMDRRFRSATWMGWVEALPPHQLMDRPVLSLGLGWALLDARRIDEAIPHLDRAERLAGDETRDEDRRVADAVQFRALPGTLAAARAYIAQARGDLEATERHARRALELIPEDDPFYRGIPSVTVGMAQWSRGEIDEAFDAFAEGLRSFRAAGNRPFAHSAMYAMADIRLHQGRLAEAEALFDGALDLEGPDAPRAGQVRCGRAEILLDRGDLDGAEAELTRAVPDDGGEPGPRWTVIMAELAAARGDVSTMSSRLGDLRISPPTGHALPPLRPFAARAARLYIGAGRLDEAERWAASLDHDGATPAPGWLYERLTLARLRCGRLAAPGGRNAPGATRSEADPARSEGDATRTEADPARTEADPAADLMQTLSELADLAEQEDSLRLQLDARLLQSDLAAALGNEREADTFRQQAHELARREGFVTPPPAPGESPDEESPLEGVLTPREREVMGLIAEGLRNKAIAKRLFISLSTVKRHVANIYAKLGVTHRTAAVARVEELSRS